MDVLWSDLSVSLMIEVERKATHCNCTLQKQHWLARYEGTNAESLVAALFLTDTDTDRVAINFVLLGIQSDST